MWWIGCVRCEKFWCDFVARTFALIAPVKPILHRVSCSNVTIQNAPKHYETLQNMSFGSNGMDRVHSLWQIPMRLCGTNFCINCSSSHRFAPNFMQLRNDNRCTQTQRNLWKYEFGVQWGGLGVFIAKNPDVTSWHELCINCISLPCFASSFMQLQNDNKCTQTLCNTRKHEFRVQRSGLGAFVAKNLDVTLWHEHVH